jgi:hypothetical protein
MRQAFGIDPIMMSKMGQVYEGRIDSGELGNNPIDSMQRAFDLFTRPPIHMRKLVEVESRVTEVGLLDSKDPAVLLQRLRLAYWVADHRVTHGKYVLRAIYKTEPVGGQSRAQGTGGSTPPFLKLFLDQTIGPGRNIIIQLLLNAENLTESQMNELRNFSAKFDRFEKQMEGVRQQGQKLEHDEKTTNYH